MFKLKSRTALKLVTLAFEYILTSTSSRFDLLLDVAVRRCFSKESITRRSRKQKLWFWGKKGRCIFRSRIRRGIIIGNTNITKRNSFHQSVNCVTFYMVCPGDNLIKTNVKMTTRMLFFFGGQIWRASRAPGRRHCAADWKKLLKQETEKMTNICRVMKGNPAHAIQKDQAHLKY